MRSQVVGRRGWFAYRAKTQTAAAPAYQMPAVTTGNLQVTVAATGPISVTTSMPLDIKQTGRVSKILVQPEDAVMAGQILATQDLTYLQNTLSQPRSTPQHVAVTKQVVPSTQKNVAPASSITASITRTDEISLEYTTGCGVLCPR